MKRRIVILRAAGRGRRRVVASPQLLEVVELLAIRACLGAGVVVLAAGGGGIPVVRRHDRLEGIEAGIDKDRSSTVLAKSLRAELLVFSTSVECVAWHFAAQTAAVKTAQLGTSPRVSRGRRVPARQHGP
jgi:carbamate kinase